MTADDSVPEKRVSLEQKIGRAALATGVVLVSVWSIYGYNAARDYEAQLKTGASNSSIVEMIEAKAWEADKKVISPEVGAGVFYVTLPGRYGGYGVQMGRQLLDVIDIDKQ
jgi:hypothetical protein